MKEKVEKANSEITDFYGNVGDKIVADVMNCRKTPVKLTGTIKDHKMYNGVKQTVMTRCKLVI